MADTYLVQFMNTGPITFSAPVQAEITTAITEARLSGLVTKIAHFAISVHSVDPEFQNVVKGALRRAFEKFKNPRPGEFELFNIDVQAPPDSPQVYEATVTFATYAKVPAESLL